MPVRAFLAGTLTLETRKPSSLSIAAGEASLGSKFQPARTSRTCLNSDLVGGGACSSRTWSRHNRAFAARAMDSEWAKAAAPAAAKSVGWTIIESGFTGVMIMGGPESRIDDGPI